MAKDFEIRCREPDADSKPLFPTTLCPICDIKTHFTQEKDGFFEDFQGILNFSKKQNLGKLQRLASLGITGAMRTTSTAAMEMLLGLPPLHLVVEAEAIAAAYRVEVIGGRNILPRKGHHTEIFTQVKDKPMLCMRSDRTHTVVDLRKPFKVEIWGMETEESMMKLRQKGGVIWFTDGSKTQASTDAGIARGRPGNEFFINLGSLAIVFEEQKDPHCH